MNRRLLFALPVGLLALQGKARAQTVAVRSHTLVEDQVIRIADIFEGSSRGDVVVGAAPNPGQRFVIEASQLAGIARRFNVEWRPMSGSERSVIERPGQALSREAAIEVLRAELLGLGLPADAELELAAFSPPILPLNALPRLSAEGGNYENASNRFAATLIVMADGMPSVRMRVTGRAIATAPAIVATRRLAVGDVVGPQDAKLVQLRAERDQAQSVANTAQTLLTTEKSAQEQLLAQKKQLEADVQTLRDDLAFFEKLIPSGGAEGIAIRGLQAERQGGQELKWRILLIQSQRNAPEFKGNLELVFVGSLNGKPWSATLPAGPKAIQFTQFGRFQGVLELPAQVVVKSLSVKVMDGSVVRATQSARLQPA